MNNNSKKIWVLWGLVILAVIGLASVVFLRRHQHTRSITDHQDRISKARTTLVAKINDRRAEPEVKNCLPVDLGHLVNSALTNSFFPKRAKENNLAEIAEGVQTYAGVPFDVKGVLQLWGKGLRPFGATFPAELKGIRLARKAKTIYLLHGAYFLEAKTAGTTIAKLVVHYTDNSQKEFDIISGQHVLDCWSPIINARVVTAPGSEIAWVGHNPWIKKRKPEWILKLYKSSFTNSNPNLEISAIDFVSTGTEAAPFMLGLTTE